MALLGTGDTSQVPGAIAGRSVGVNGGASGWTSSGNRLFAMNYQETPERARLKVVEGGWAGPGQRVGGKVSIRGE